MIPDTTADRYYYIFDSRERRAVAMDRVTGEEFAWADDPRAQLVRHVDERCPEAAREFAVWCAREVGGPEAAAHTPAGRLWAAIEQEAEAGDYESVREATADAAVIASAVGLPHRDPEAARLLTVQAATHSDPVRAAIDTAHLSERWAEFQAIEGNRGGEPEEAAGEMRRRHVNRLLDVLGRRQAAPDQQPPS